MCYQHGGQETKIVIQGKEINEYKLISFYGSRLCRHFSPEKTPCLCDSPMCSIGLHEDQSGTFESLGCVLHLFIMVTQKICFCYV